MVVRRRLAIPQGAMPKLWLTKFSAGFLFLCLGGLFALAGGTAFATEREAWSLNEAIGLPGWLSISGEHQARYETLNSQFRANSTGSDQILSLRTLVMGEIRLDKSFKINAELQDSRAELADTGSRMNNSIVNTAELLQANLTWSQEDLFVQGSRSRLRGGRLTMDIGKRRLVARNRLRSVIQAYTGLDWKWIAKEGNQLRMFLTLPVNRRPEDKASLLDNEAKIDKETTDLVFWGLWYAPPQLPWGHKGELFLLGLHEKDGPDFATRNRQLYTTSIRVYRPAQTGAFDYELQSVLQLGTSRATAAAGDTRDLDHQAHFHHAEAGYSFEARWSPRLYFEYDFVSGDDDPNDGTNDGFDLLYAPNVPEFGPTGIYSAFVRGNLSSPGVRLQVRPDKNLKAYFSYRAFWLASSTDIWAGASGLRDTTGNSGTFLGHQLLLRGMWKARPNIHLEGAVTYRIDGDFQKTAPNSPREGDTVYSYLQVAFLF